MNKDLDVPSLQQMREALEEDLSSIDQNTERKLRAARYAALERYDRDKPLKTITLPQYLILGFIFASSLCVVIGIWLVQPIGQIGTQIGEDHVMLEGISAREISVNEMEIVEDLEFYEWLDSNGYAG